MNKYELMYIIDVALEEEPRKALVERISQLIADNGGTVEKVDEWGRRRLAYAINYRNEGYYVLENFEAPSSLPREIERVLQINENVLRYMIVKLEEKHTSVKPRQTPRPAFGRPPEPPLPGEDRDAPAPRFTPRPVAQPAATQPTATQPAATQPAAEQPVATQAPMTNEPGAAVAPAEDTPTTEETKAAPQAETTEA